MRTIEIKVSDANCDRVMNVIAGLGYVEIVTVKDADGDLVASAMERPDAPTVGSAEARRDKLILSAAVSDPSEQVGSGEKARTRGNLSKLPAESTGSVEVRGNQRKVDEITLMSEKSFAEEWDSEEDDRYDEMYRKRDLEDEIQKG